MGKLFYSISVSLDGFVETPSRPLDWVLVDDELHSLFNAEARSMRAFLYGRRMYELMVVDPAARRADRRVPALRAAGDPGRWHAILSAAG